MFLRKVTKKGSVLISGLFLNEEKETDRESGRSLF